MTKVERLRDDLCQQIVYHDSFAGTLASTVLKAINSLISAAYAEGKAEGAEQMAEYIRENCKVIQDREYGQMLAITEDELDPSVLAPTKEKP